MKIIPKNEAELIFRFAQEMPIEWELLRLQAAFPDAALKIDGKIYKTEFEYKSKGFIGHEHDLTQADLIICWVHDWHDCPLPVLELRNPSWVETLLFEVILQEKARASAEQLRQANPPKRLWRAQTDLDIAKKEKNRADVRVGTVRKRLKRIEANLRKAQERKKMEKLPNYKQARQLPIEELIVEAGNLHIGEDSCSVERACHADFGDKDCGWIPARTVRDCALCKIFLMEADHDKP